MLKITDYCTPVPVKVSCKDKVINVLQAFLENQLDIVCVVDDSEKLIGIVSKNSLYRALLNGADINSSIETMIRREVVTITNKDSFDKARDIMLENRVSHGVIVDSETNDIIGVVSKANIIHGFLDESEILRSQISNLIEHLQDAVVAINDKEKIVSFNKSSENIFGFTNNLVTGEPINKWLPELYQELTDALNKQITTQNKRIQVGENTVIGTFIPVKQKNKVTGAMAILQDITKLEDIAQELESTKNLQHTMHHALKLTYDAIVIVDEKGFIKDINDAFLELFEINNESVFGEHCDDIIPDLNMTKILEEKTSEKDIRKIKGTTCFVIQEPIIRSNKTLGAITKIIYRQLDEWKDVFGRLEELESELSYYRNELQRVNVESKAFEGIVSASENMQKLKEQAMLAAQSTSTVLITGESGTGKELFAEAIHKESKRSGNYVKVNCAAIPADLLESEFFGYVDGAFTGASKGGKIGKFELADKGTLFLDEIGDMPLSLQSKLLRVLQDQKFERIGDVKTRKVDVRIICATNKDLKEMVEKGTFREDLYYRIDVVSLSIPPLRKRIDDLPFLSDYLIKKLNKKLNKNVIGITPQTLTLLQQYNWPGNVRQLENVLERAMNMGVTQWIEPLHLPEEIISKEIKHFNPSLENSFDNIQNYQSSSLENIEKQLIIQTLEKTNNNRSEAARILGISRSGLYQKIKKYNIQEEIRFHVN